MRASSRCALASLWAVFFCKGTSAIPSDCTCTDADQHLTAAALPLSPVPAPQAVVREGDQYTDHPVHLGGEAFVLAELKVTPVVEKKVPGK